MIFERVFKSFLEHKLKYVVIGGIAVNLHGYNRMTGDLDIIISLNDENISKFNTIIEELGLIPRLPLKIADFANDKIRASWITEKNMKVFSVYNPKNPLEHIDVKIDRPEKIDFYLKNSQKLQAGRDRDLVDIRALERIRSL